MRGSLRAIPGIVLVLTIGLASVDATQLARFSGRVVDFDGEPIAGVKITLRNVENGATVEISSDDNGRYFRRALPIGMYEITFEKEGYVPARDQRRLGSGQTAHDAVLEPMRTTPTDPSASPEYRAAFESFQTGDQERVIEILTPVAAAEPEFVPGHLLLARAHFELEHWEEAIAGYRRVIALQPAIGGAYLDLGVALVETGDTDGASEMFQQALDLQPDDAAVHYNVGAIYVRADRIDDAIHHLTRATELEPNGALAHKALAFALVRTGDTEGAIRHLERYLEISPDAADAAEMTALLEQLRGS